jgi:hypothetical protein
MYRNIAIGSMIVAALTGAVDVIYMLMTGNFTDWWTVFFALATLFLGTVTLRAGVR